MNTQIAHKCIYTKICGICENTVISEKHSYPTIAPGFRSCNSQGLLQLLYAFVAKFNYLFFFQLHSNLMKFL